MLTQLQTFDFANPDETTAQRNITTAPTQSLFMMNAEFPMEMAAALAESVDVSSSSSAEEIGVAIETIYQRVFLRSPTAGELAAGRAFIESSSAAAAPVSTSNDRVSAWEFGYAPYDRTTGEHGLDDVRPFPFLGRWKMQGGPEFPDEKNGFGWLQLRSTGGHAGGGKQCLVQRWSSPVSGRIEISGELIHNSEIGDGIRATIYHNRTRLGQWSALNGKANTGVKSVTVENGDVVDFIVDCIENGSYDGYLWSPLITPIEASPSIPGRAAWSPKRDFPKPPDSNEEPKSKPHGPWAQYVHVLLMSNEFVNIE